MVVCVCVVLYSSSFFFLSPFLFLCVCLCVFLVVGDGFFACGLFFLFEGIYVTEGYQQMKMETRG